jgi:hypothetical protein
LECEGNGAEGRDGSAPSGGVLMTGGWLAIAASALAKDKAGASD